MSSFFSFKSLFSASIARRDTRNRSAKRFRERSCQRVLKRRLLTESLEPRQMLDGEDLVRLVLTARDIETDELLNNTDGVAEMAADSEQSLTYNVPINEVFKLEVAVQDLRPRGSSFGVFRAVTDIVVGSKGVLEPAIGEVQEIILPGTITDAGLPAGEVELFLEDAPGVKVTSSLNAFLGANDQVVEQNIANAIVSLNSQVTSVSQINVNVFTKPDAGPDGEAGYVIEIVYNDPSFIGLDMPMLNATVTVGGVVQADIENEFDVYVDGQINGERMYHFFETRNRNVGNGTSNVYGQTRVIGVFDNTNPTTDIFDEVGGLGPVSSGGISDGIPDFSRTIAYDAFAIPVIARSLATNVLVELDAPDDGDKILIYGTETDREGVPDDQIQFGGNSRFFLNVTPPQPLLEASNTSRSLVEDQNAITIDLSSLVAADPGALTYSLASTTSLGTSELAGTTLTYTPAADAFGTETLIYRVARNGTDDFDQGVITLTINGVNDAPVANDDSRDTNEDTSLAISVSGLLENDTDVDTDDTLTLVSVGTANSGTVTLNGNTITYNPSANFFGDDSFTYTMRDNAGITQTATVRIDVIAVNDPPTATGENAQTEPDTPISFAIADLLANDSAGPLESSQALTITEVGGLTNPSSSVVIDGDFVRYTPASGFTGNDAFTYTVSDGSATVTATVNMNVEFVVEPVTLVLSDATSNDITVRRIDGTHLEIIDNSTTPPTRLMRRPLNTITTLTISGSDTSADRVQIDHASGGLITFIGNSSTIQVLGGQTAGDELLLTGLSNFNALLSEVDSETPSILNGLRANLQLGGLFSNQSLSGFETVSIEGIREILVPSNSILDVGAHELNLDSDLPVNLSQQTRIDGGTLTSTSQLALTSGEQLSGNGTVVARIVAPTGSIISANGGDLTMGTSEFTSSVDIAGQLNTFGNNITLVDGDAATLRGSITIGEAGNAAGSISPGSITSTTGLLIQPGTQVTGHGSIQTGNDAANGLINNGNLVGTSATSPITVNGALSGTGAITNVEVASQWNPTGLINNRLDGTVVLTSTANMTIDIGGTVAGATHDRFRFNPSITLGGTLDVNLVNGFSPSAGHEFEIMAGIGSIDGQFDTLNLPVLVDGLKWSVGSSTNALTLQVVLDGSALSENVNVEVDSAGQIIIRGQNDQPIPIAGNELTLDVQPTQRFSSPQAWATQPSQSIDGTVYQIATNRSATLRIAGANWTNFIQRFDINANGTITATDALVIINELNRPQYSNSSTSLLDDIDSVPTFPNIYFDANGDGRVSAVDALQVINKLIEQDASGENAEPINAFTGPAPVAASPVSSRVIASRPFSEPEELSPTTRRAIDSAIDSAIMDWLQDDEPHHHVRPETDEPVGNSNEGSPDLETTLEMLVTAKPGK